MDQLLINLTTRRSPLLLSSARIGRWQLATRPAHPPPFFRQFFLRSFLGQRSRLGFSPRPCDGSPSLSRFCLRSRLQWPRWRRASRGQVARQPQLLRKFFLLDSGGRLFRNLVRGWDLWLRFFSGGRFRMAFLCYGTRWAERSGGPATHSLFFVDKTPDGPHQMRHGNVNATFSENLRDPMDAETATMRFQDLFLVLPQRFNLGLFTVATPVRIARDLKKILGSGFEMIRISQWESGACLWIYDKEMTKWRSNSGSQYRSTSISSKSFSSGDLRQVPGSRSFLRTIRMI